MAKSLASQVCTQWKKSNAQFKSPVTLGETRIADKIEITWISLKETVNPPNSISHREKIKAELDKVFDILNCKCPILLCGDLDPICVGCINAVHINCICPVAHKLPKLDLLWVYSQRTKVGDKSNFQYAGIEFKDTKRQMEAKKRQVEQIGRSVKYLKSEEVRPIDIEEMPIDISSSSNEVSLESVESHYQPSASHRIFKLINTAAASIRCGVSQRSTAAITTGFLQDLIEAGFLS